MEIRKFHDNNLAYQLNGAKNREALSLHKNCQGSVEGSPRTYSNLENSALIFDLISKLWQSKQGDCGVTEYYNEMLILR